MELTINKKQYPIKWDYSVVRFFCKRREIEKIADYAHRLGSIKFDNLTIENLEDLAYMLLSLVDRGVEIQGQVNDLTISDAFDWLYSDTENLTKLTQIISNGVRDVSQKKTATKKKAH